MIDKYPSLSKGCMSRTAYVSIFVWALASVLVEQTGGYSKLAWKHAALWVNISQGHIVVLS